MEKVLFIGDFGVDDAVALIYAHLSGSFDIVGAVADYGNMPRHTAVRNARYLLNLLGMKKVNVITGAEGPFNGEPPQYFPDVHGPEGLGSIIPELKAASPRENFHEVIKIIEQYKDELIIVNTGRLTSLASLFIFHGALMRHIKAYYIMGGAFLSPGNITPSAEANIYGDPIAARVVMNRARNLTIFPLNSTMKAVVTEEMSKQIDKKDRMKLIQPLLVHYYDFYKMMHPEIKGSPVHDVLPFAAMIDDKMFNYAYMPVDIVIENGSALGQSIGDFRGSLQIYAENSHKIALDLNYREFYDNFMNVMTGCYNEDKDIRIAD